MSILKDTLVLNQCLITIALILVFSSISSGDNIKSSASQLLDKNSSRELLNNSSNQTQGALDSSHNSNYSKREIALIFPRGAKPADLHPTTPPNSSQSLNLSTSSNNSTPTNILAPSGSDDDFDENAVQRAFIVLAGLGLILVSYFAAKFFCVKRRREPISQSSRQRYGLVESSEMDLLESNDDDEYTGGDEEDTLFDLHSHRHT